jgi:hypothetical protein
LPDQTDEFLYACRIDPRGGFIQNNHFRIFDEYICQAQTLAHSPGIFTGLFIDFPVKPYPFEELGCMLPGFLGGQAGFGDVFVFVYLLALGRFFMAVSSMDAATAFGGMGGSREVYVAAFVEPVVMLAVLSNVLHTNSTLADVWRTRLFDSG